MTPSRGNLLVKPIDTQEVVNGVVLLEETRARWTGQQCEVVQMGAPEICEDEDCWRAHRINGVAVHLCTVSVGDWIVVKPRSYTATDIDDVWVVRQDDVLARLVLAE